MLIILGLLLPAVALLTTGLGVAVAEDAPKVLLTADNIAPHRLPTLGVWDEYSKKHDQRYTYLSASFPNVPGCTCDLWCFESAGIRYANAKPLTGGGIEMRHTWQGHPWDVVTTATPHEGSVEVVARLEPVGEESTMEPKEYPSLNICWQLRRAKGFCSKPDPYPEFVKRCFIFTHQGRTFLDNTKRLPIPVRPVTDNENNPPWVQMYLPESAPPNMDAGPKSWASFSPDRYTLPIIGAVSRDGKSLAAIATGAEVSSCQAWHDCMHINARWLPVAGNNGREWRLHVYVMENDPIQLIDRFKNDFPNVQPWQND